MILDVRDLLDNDERAVELFTNGIIHYTSDDVELITLSQILKTAGKLFFYAITVAFCFVLCYNNGKKKEKGDLK